MMSNEAQQADHSRFFKPNIAQKYTVQLSYDHDTNVKLNFL